MSKLPILSYREVEAKLKKAGFVCERTTKHNVYVNKEKNLTIPVPRHSGDMPKGTLRAIIRQSGFTVDYFISL